MDLKKILATVTLVVFATTLTNTAALAECSCVGPSYTTSSGTYCLIYGHCK